MAPVKPKLANKSVAEKCKALKNLEMGCQTKMLLLNTVSHETLYRHGLIKTQINSFVGKKGNELLTKKYALWELGNRK